MNINEIVKIQEGVKRISQDNKVGKKIVENAEYNVINELMGKIKGKKGKKGQNQTVLSTQQTNPAYNLSLSDKAPPPIWSNIRTKSEPTMTDEEMENKMAELGREFAERSAEIGNSGKPSSMINRQLKNLRDEFEFRKADLMDMYVSVVSPDRKAAYAASNGDHKVYGNETNYRGDNELMYYISSSGIWAMVPTNAEIERLGKLNNVFSDTILAYEAEHNLKIPHTTISNSWVV